MEPEQNSIATLYRSMVDSHKLEPMQDDFASFPSFFGLGLEDALLPTFWAGHFGSSLASGCSFVSDPQRAQKPLIKDYDLLDIGMPKV